MNKIAAILGLLGGTSLLLYWGGESPDWLRNVECLLLMGAALAVGFTARDPSMPDWLRSDAVLGVALVYIGVGAAFVPPNLLISSACIGSGLRLVCRSAIAVSASRPTSRDIVVKSRGGITRR